MTEQVHFEEIFQYPIQEFKVHLEQDYNERIIFSGKYGIGKTKFLETFFNDQNQISILGDEKYDVYRLFPTNYSIASNEDIIRYIKYDIIIEMLKKSISLEEVKLNLSDTLPSYIFKDLHKVTAALVYMIPKLGKEVVECFEKIDTLKEEYLKYHDEANKSSGDKLVDYLNMIEVKEGSVYEGDITTKIISEVISKENGKESILLIDDVDRLDPEHVFRILNVFASHFDSNSVSSNKNKFNFDKIIIVCDFNNIRNIFHHRYGIEADFMGYIDKFYSSDVYHFDNKQAIVGIIIKIFESIEIQGTNQNNESIYRSFYFKNEFLSKMIGTLVHRGSISLRNIIKIYKKQIAYHSELISFGHNHIEVYSWRVPITMQLRLLKDFFGDLQSMKKQLSRLSLPKDYSDYYHSYFGLLIYILSYEKHNFNPRNDFLYEYKNITLVVDAKLGFASDQLERVNLYHFKDLMKTDKIPERGEYYYATEELFFEALDETIELLIKIEFLK